MCNSFPLLRIEEALQAVKAAVWFTSFDLTQGYLQLAMDEADIHKTVLSVLVLWDCTSLLICPLDSRMLELVFLSPYGDVLGRPTVPDATFLSR